MSEIHIAVCRECDWEQAGLNREQAVHAKHVHEEEFDHAVVIEEAEE